MTEQETEKVQLAGADREHRVYRTGKLHPMIAMQCAWNADARRAFKVMAWSNEDAAVEAYDRMVNQS